MTRLLAHSRHRKRLRQALDRAARLAVAVELVGDVDGLRALEAAMRDAAGELARLRRTHHVNTGRAQALAARRAARSPDGPDPAA